MNAVQNCFSDWIIYVDESGDHGFPGPKEFPIFVLSFCVFKKSEYIERVIPAFASLKFELFGHDQIIFHERDIRKRQGAFVEFDPTKLFCRLSAAIAEFAFTIISVVIRKNQLSERYPLRENPYHLAMRFGLERLYMLLAQENGVNACTYLVFESRGKNEDNQLKEEFQRFCTGANYWKRPVKTFALEFAKKHANSAGLQIADLVSYPIGKYVLEPAGDKPQVQFVKEVLWRKFYGHPQIDGRGLKIFPKQH